MPPVAVRAERATEPSSLLVGCGGAGKNIAASASGRRKITVDSVEADIRLDRSAISVAETDFSLIASANPPFYARVRREIEAVDVVFIVAGMGGFAGGVASSAVARAARACGKTVIASVALPFDVEGPVRRTSARKSLEALGSAANVTVPFENNIINHTMSNVRITRALAIMNRIVLSPIEEIMQYADTDFIDGLRRTRRRGIYAVSHASGLDWERKGAHSILSELGENTKHLKELNLFLSMNTGMDDSADRLGNEVARQIGGCRVTVWVKGGMQEGQNRIGALGLF